MDHLTKTEDYEASVKGWAKEDTKQQRRLNALCFDNVHDTHHTLYKWAAAKEIRKTRSSAL